MGIVHIILCSTTLGGASACVDVAKHEPVGDNGGDNSDSPYSVDTAPNESKCDEDTEHPWARYTLRGTLGIDDRLGDNTSLGDIDGDGLDDILVAPAFESPYVYLLLGSTLAAYDHGSCRVGDIADYTFILNAWSVTTDTSYGGEREYGWYSVDVLLQAGVLYVGNPVETNPSLPMVYRIDWDTLVMAGPGTYELADVADTVFSGTQPVGGNLVSCDVNGDGERDLLIGSRYLQFDAGSTYGSVDVDADVTQMYYAVYPDFAPCSLNSCDDLNSDSVDDLVMSCREPGDNALTLNIYYGNISFGRSGVLDLETPDVAIKLGYESYVTDAYIYSTEEGVSDWNADGNKDLIVNSYSYHPDQSTSSSGEVLLFLGGAGFYPSGVTLTRDDSHFTIVDPSGGSLGVGASIRGDLNDDAVNDIVVSHPGGGIGDAGDVYVRYSPLPYGRYDVDEFAEAAYTGAAEDGIWGESLGDSVFASRHITGNSVDDLVITSPGDDYSGAIYIVEK